MMIETAIKQAPFDELILRHQQLLARNAKGEAAPEDREAMVAQLIGAGAYTPSGSERDALRNMLYFWIAEQGSRDNRPLRSDLPALADYQAPRVETRGEASPTSGKPAGTRGDPAGETRARAILRLAALGRQWRLGKDPAVRDGYLLTGMALEEAKPYRAEDPDIEALVLASEKRRDHKRIVFFGMAIVALLVFIAGVTYLWRKAESNNVRLSISEAAARRSEQDAREAESSMRIAKQALETQVTEAVQALAHGDLEPLKQFLRESGDSDGAKLALLKLSASSAQTYQSDNVKAPTQRRVGSGRTPTLGSTTTSVDPTPNPTPSATTVAGGPGLDACLGYIWLGAADDSHVVGQSNPLDVRAGDKIVIDARSDYRLRARAPDARYAMGAQLGIVPGGSTLNVTGAPVSVTPPAAGAKAQIWAPVSVPATFCTTVYIQYAGNSRSVVVPVSSALNEIAVQVPQPELLASAKGLAEVRYYFPADEKVASLVARQLAPFNHGAPLKLVLLANFQNKPKPRTIEVWLDLSE